MLNKAMIIGNLGDDPKIINDGNIANFSVATTEKWKDKATGEQKEKTEWHRVVSFSEGLNSNVIAKYMNKGDRVFVEGKIQTRKWEDDTGTTRYSTEIVIDTYNGTLKLLSNKGESAEPASRPTPENQDPIDELD